MTAWRQFLLCLGVLGVLALAAPAVTLAQGGGGASAGDNQYVNPLGNSGSGSSSSGSSGSHSSGSSSSGSSGSSSSSSGSGEAAPTTTSSAPTDTAPTATTSSAPPTTASPSDPSGTTASGSTQTLPYTGFNDGLAAVCGLALVGGGLLLRRRVRRS